MYFSTVSCGDHHGISSRPEFRFRSGFKNHDPVGYYLLTWNVWQRPVGDGAVEGLRNQEDGQHFRSVGCLETWSSAPVAVEYV